MSSLATVRDALLLAHYQKIIDDVEFAVLYDANLAYGERIQAGFSLFKV